MSIKKQFLKSKPVCKTTFVVTPETAPEAENVVVVGDFNEWNPEKALEMKKLKNGSFKATIDLEAGKEYEFRYLIDENTWTNDEGADKYVPSPFGTENSVVSCLN
jgi:1,4-alpha-glucan branching enzyme